LCDLNDEGPYDPEDPYNIPPEYTTTLDPLSRNLSDDVSDELSEFFSSHNKDPFSDLTGHVNELKNNMVESPLFKFNKNNFKTAPPSSESLSRASRSNPQSQFNLSKQSHSHQQQRNQSLVGLYSRNICPNDKKSQLNENNFNLRDAIVPDEVIYPPDTQDLFSVKPMVQFIHENTFASVVTENNKIYTFFQVYVSAFADYQRTTYNNRVTASRQISNPPPVNRNLLNMLTNGMKF